MRFPGTTQAIGGLTQRTLRPRPVERRAVSRLSEAIRVEAILI